MKIDDLLRINISYYVNVSHNISYKTVTLYDWITKYALKNKDRIETIRDLYVVDKNKAKKMKSYLPCVTMTGVFDSFRRMYLVKHINPIFVIDIDKDDNPDITDWDELKHKIASLPYVFLTSYSVSGKGLYCIIYFNTELNIEYMFNALKIDFNEMGINIDKNCKDITRLRFISYDNNILIRQNDVEMYNKEAKIETNINYQSSGQMNEDDDFTYAAIYHLITECNYRSNSYNDWLKDGFRLATFGKLGYALFMLLSIRSDNYNEYSAKQKWNECTKTTKYDKSCLSYYFKLLKDHYGKDWKSKII